MAEAVYKRRIGDRKDGRLLRSYPAYNKFTPFVMKTTNDACNYFEDSIEITEIDRWLREKRREGYKGMGIMHLSLQPMSAQWLFAPLSTALFQVSVFTPATTLRF